MSSAVGMGRSSHARMRIANSNLQRGAVEMDVSRMSLQKFKSWEAVYLKRSWKRMKKVIL